MTHRPKERYPAEHYSTAVGAHPDNPLRSSGGNPRIIDLDDKLITISWAHAPAKPLGAFPGYKTREELRDMLRQDATEVNISVQFKPVVAKLPPELAGDDSALAASNGHIAEKKQPLISATGHSLCTNSELMLNETLNNWKRLAQHAADNISGDVRRFVKRYMRADVSVAKLNAMLLKHAQAVDRAIDIARKLDCPPCLPKFRGLPGRMPEHVYMSYAGGLAAIQEGGANMIYAMLRAALFTGKNCRRFDPEIGLEHATQRALEELQAKLEAAGLPLLTKSDKRYVWANLLTSRSHDILLSTGKSKRERVNSMVVVQLRKPRPIVKEWLPPPQHLRSLSRNQPIRRRRSVHVCT